MLLLHLAGDLDRPLLVLESGKDLDELAQEEVSRGEQEIEEHDHHDRLAHEGGGAAEERVLDPGGGPHDRPGPRARFSRDRPFHLVGGAVHLLQRGAQRPQPALDASQAGRRLGDPLRGRGDQGVETQA